MGKGLLGVRGIVLLLATVLLGLGVSASAMAASTPAGVKPTASTTARATGEPTLASTMPQVRYGNSGVNVLALQLALREKGYWLQGTGYYGEKTLSAVRGFQGRNGIRNSGIVGPKTWKALLGNRTVSGGGPAVPTFGLQPGECSGNKMGQLAERVLRVYPYQTGYGRCYDRRWQAMVRDFQSRAGIRNSGIVGPKTWAALHKVVTASTGWAG